MNNELVLVAASGGLDSTTTLAVLKAAGYSNIVACHFDYGCRSGDAEKIAITNVCKTLGVPLKLFDIKGIMTQCHSTSMLTDKSAKITTGTSDGLKTTQAWVANRNGLFMNVMAAYAEGQVMEHNYDKVYFVGGFLNLSESGCIPLDTHQGILSYDRVTGEFIEVPFNSVREGSMIVSFNTDKYDREPTCVKKVLHTKHNKKCIIHATVVQTDHRIPTGIIRKYPVSCEHPFYVCKHPEDAWVNAEDLKPGDLVFLYRPDVRMQVQKVEILIGSYDMKNFHCEPNQNFYLGKTLTHNSYPDNSEYFLNACLNLFKYSTLIGNRISPMYCLSNIVKHEQFQLIKAFGLEDVYSHTISCDRAIVDDKGIPRNCSKNGMPACGSGLLSYWGAKIAGMDDMKLRNFYEIPEDYTAYIPDHMIDPNYVKPDIHDIINRISLDPDRLETLHGLVK